MMAWSFLRGLEASRFEVSSFEVLLERCKKESGCLLGPKSVSFTTNPPRSFPSGGLPRPRFFDTFLILFSHGLWDAFFPLDAPKRAPLDPLLGGKMAPKSFQSGLQDAFNSQNESLQIPSVLQHFCALERVPRRE